MKTQKPQNVTGMGVSAKIFNKNIITKPSPNVKRITSNFKSSRPKFLNQTIVDLVKSFIRENKPDQAIEVLQSVGFGDGLAEFFVSAILKGVIA